MQVDFIDELNDIQRQAVTNVKGPVMIIAGPGSGKTRVLTYRIAYLIKSGVDSFRIMALTFTNKASAEMRDRIEQLVGTEAKNLYMGTFHSVFAKVLRIEGHRMGYPNNFTIYDTQDAKSLIKSIVKELGLNDKLYKANYVYGRISSAKNSLITPAKYRNSPDLMSEDEASGRPRIAEIYAKYAKRCFLAGAMDFDDLLMKTHELLDGFPDVLHKYQHRFSYLMIDEFQDTNFAQYEIVRKLAAVHENICVVGDDAQSIYAFRGATIANIMSFEKDYTDLKVFKLEQNYRSTQHIVNVANQVIANNREQLEKTIWTEKTKGEKIKIIRAASDSDEARNIAGEIFNIKVREQKFNQDFAILYRTNAQSRALEEALRKINIAYRVYGGLSFYQRKEIKDFVGYLRVTVNPNDEEALKRIINYPTRGIGKTTVEKLIIAASENDCSLWDALSNKDIIRFPARAQNALDSFVIMIKSFRAQLASNSAFDIAMLIGKSSGLVHELFKDKSIEGISRYENLQELLNGIREFTEEPQPEYEEDEVIPENDLAAYLQQISLLTDADQKDDDPDKVKLMTIHAAKGLEFPVVFVSGLEENLFPSFMSMNTRKDIEEERRLFYVAVTRAEEKLILTHAATRFKFGSLVYCDESRFLQEIAESEVERVGNSTKAVQKPRNDWSKPNRSKSFQPKPKTPTTMATIDNKLKKLKKVNTNTTTQIFEQASSLEGLSVGMEVLHQKFDKGKVVHIEGGGGNKIATIFFEDHGQKKIMLKFAKLQLI